MRDRPAGGDTERLFLTFGGPVCADRISNCPLDRVLTYKNLIYLLNLQFFKPLGKISRRLLTFKMVFLLTLASGKGRRVILVSIVFPYLKGVLLTSGSGHLLAKNQLASDGPTSVKPVPYASSQSLGQQFYSR